MYYYYNFRHCCSPAPDVTFLVLLDNFVLVRTLLVKAFFTILEFCFGKRFCISTTPRIFRWGTFLEVKIKWQFWDFWYFLPFFPLFNFGLSSSSVILFCGNFAFLRFWEIWCLKNGLLDLSPWIYHQRTYVLDLSPRIYHRPTSSTLSFEFSLPLFYGFITQDLSPVAIRLGFITWDLSP